MRTFLNRVLPAISAVFLVSCGGGGGGSSPPPPAAPSGLSYPAPPSFAVGTAIAPLTPAVTGTVTSYAVAPALPAGLTLNADSGVISGTPTAIAATANYVVTAGNSVGNTTATISLTVIVNAPVPVVTYGASSHTFTVGVPVNLIPFSAGGAVVTWSLDQALPVGLAMSGTTGIISGTPTQPAVRSTYVVTAQNTGGTDADNLSIAVVAPTVDSSVLLHLGHTSGTIPIFHDGTRILSGNNDSFVLWNALTGAMVASTWVDCDGVSPCGSGEKMALHGPTAVIRRASGFEVWSSVDGSVIASIAWPVNVGSWWKLAADGSYIAAGNATGLTVWSPTGAILFQRSGNQNAVNAFAAAGELRLATGPAGNDVIEHLALPAGTSTVTPTFLGTFHSWFMDGESFFSNAGNTVWMYSHAAALRDFVALPSVAELAGQGDWAWTKTFAPSILRIYRVGSSAAPAASYSLSAIHEVVPSTGTIAIAESTLTESNEISVVDLSGATPIRRDFTAPLPSIRGFGSASSSDWVFTNIFGAMFGELGPTPPTRYSLGAARSIAGSDSRIAVATASGSIFYFDANTRQLQGEIEFTSGKVQLSADGNVLAASAETEYSQYAPDRTLRVFSLPSEIVLAQWPHSYPDDYLWDFTLSRSGTVIGRWTSPVGAANVTSSVTLLDGTPIWSQVRPHPASFIPIHISPNGTLIALADSEPAPATATNIYLNGTLSSAASGYSAGWVDDGRLLLNRYGPGDPSNIRGYRGVDLVDSNGLLLAGLLPLPEIFEIQGLSGNRIYSPRRNEVFDLSTGARVWSSTAPHDDDAGAVAGANVVFTSKATVRIEPL